MASHEKGSLTHPGNTSQVAHETHPYVNEDWMNFAVDCYRRLAQSQRNEFLDRLLDADGCVSQLIHLSEKVTELLRLSDFVRLMPPEVSELVFSYLDAESLLHCCRVSRRWNNYISQLDVLWEKECKRLGMDAETIMTTTRRTKGFAAMKRIYQRRAKLLGRMVTGTAFYRTDLRFHEKSVTAVWYFNGKIYAGCSDESISIWDATTCHLLRMIIVNFSPTCIKSDSKVLLASSSVGTLAAWKENELGDLKVIPGRLNYERHAGSVFSFDFDTKLDLLVSGSSDLTVKLWRLSSTRLITTLYGHNKWVVKVLLGSESKLNSKRYILSQQCDAFYIWIYNTNDASCVLQKSVRTCPVSNFYTPGLNLHHHCVISPVQDGDSIRTDLQSIDLSDNAKMSTRLTINLKVKKLLTMGDRYVCFVLPQRKDPNVVVLDLITLKPVARLNIPQSAAVTPNLEQICFCDDRWLNRLGFDNGGLPLIAVGLENGNICLFKWSLEDVED